MAKRMILMLVAIGLIIGVITFFKVKTIKAGIAIGKSFAPLPTPVTTVVVEPEAWQPVISAVGTIKAVNGVDLSADLPGTVMKITFESGTEVKKGDVLLKLDTRQEEAQLHSAQAKRDFAKADLGRKKDLIDKKAIAPTEWDTAESQLRQADAAVEESRAMIERKTITAPFDGLLGIRQVNLGQYLNSGSVVTPLQSLDPIYIEFPVPQTYLDKIATGRKVQIRAQGAGELEFTGDITAIDSKIDESTRNVKIQATIANPDRKLRPGMFASVEVLLPKEEGVLAIPSSSIHSAPYSDTIYIVQPAVPDPTAPIDPKNPAHPIPPGSLEVVEQVVKLGEKRGDKVRILSGVKPGDEVVTSGVFKLRPHSLIKVNNEVTPGNDIAPHPADT